MGGILFKLIYSALLLGLSIVLLRELWTVWFNHQVYIGSFEAVSETGKDEEAGAAFAKRIVAAQAILAQQLTDYQTRTGIDAPSDATYLLPGTATLRLPPQALEGIDITVQNVNLSQLLTVVRRRFLAPDEVRGHVTVREGSVLTAVDWPRAPRSADGHAPLTHFLLPSQATLQGAAAYVACSVSWARAASLQKNIAALSRAQFCDFAIALGDLYALSGKASQTAGLNDTEVALVRARVAMLRTYYDADKVFADLYRLRADLLELLPAKVRTQDELVEAQENRVRYAMLSPELRDLPEEEKRAAALALARPAILLQKGTPLRAPQNWVALLGSREALIQAAAASTGLIVRSDNTPVGTGFIVGPGLLLTATFVIEEAKGRSRRSDIIEDRERLRLCLGPSSDSCEATLTVGEIIHRSQTSQVVIAHLMDHDPIDHPPLRLSASLPEASTLVGGYAYVIGYPYYDQRVPQPFLQRLLDGLEGKKRLMPGRILAFGTSVPFSLLGGESNPSPVFTTDISTTGGTAGGPLLDLTSGTVVGMSYGGVWKGERGKFAYAQIIPKAARDLIDRRTRGAPDRLKGAKRRR